MFCPNCNEDVTFFTVKAGNGENIDLVKVRCSKCHKEYVYSVSRARIIGKVTKRALKKESPYV